MDDKIFQQIADDEVFQKFIDESFDSKEYAARVIEAHAISQQLSRLAEGINLLDKELKNHVVNHHEDLLSQATGLETLEGVLQMMQSRSKSLLTAIERIRSRIIEPYNKISVRTTQLRQLQETCDILRNVIRAVYLSKRLQSQLQSGTKEITKAAQSLNELEHLSSSGVDLSGINIIEADQKFIQQAHIDVEAHGKKMLQQGMENQNQTQVGTALQIFFNLSCLRETITKTTEVIHKQIEETINASFDINQLTLPSERKSGPGRISGLSNTGNTANLRAAFWINIEKVVDLIYSSYFQILLLQKILARKKDPLTHTFFIDYLEQEQNDKINLLKDFWTCVLKYLEIAFNKTMQGNSLLKQALESEYLKLLRYFGDLCRRLETLMSMEKLKTDQNVEGQFSISTLIDINLEKEIRNTFIQFEVLYLSRSLSRLFDPVNLLFSTNNPTPPNQDEIEGFIRIINNELTAASFDEKLSISVARNVNKTVTLFCSKSENMVNTDESSCQVIGPPSPAQLLNASIVNSLYFFSKSLNKIFDNLLGLTPAGVDILRDSLKSVDVLLDNCLQPLLSSISSAIEDILMTMHDEDFSQPLHDNQPEKPMCSLYMKELEQFVTRVTSTYGLLYQCHELVQQRFVEIGRKCLNLFVRHSSLICPLGESGKLRLAADYAQMELAISPFCNKLSDLGKPYRLIRAIRPMLFQTAENISQSAALVEVVPLSLILHFLAVRGYPALKPLHETAGWTCRRYSQWLDEHENERDRLSFIKGSLESYAQSVTSRGGKEFVSIYPVMISLLQRGLKQA